MTDEQAEPDLVAVDIGNSRIKLGRFRRECAQRRHHGTLPEPIATFDVPILNRSGEFEEKLLSTWADLDQPEPTEWLIASVHRGAAERLITILRQPRARSIRNCSIRQLTFRDIAMPIGVDAPERVGIDRLLAAFAANRLRAPDRPAIVVDLGTAITVDVIQSDGAFAGGAILPGIATAARALAEQTDALPQVDLEILDKPPEPLGKATVPAIEAGLYWGAIGAIRELIARLSDTLSPAPEVFITGGASKHVAELLGESLSVQHVPNLVLSGIALVAR